MTNHNDLRADQALFNHGPGAILETVDGPAVVRDYADLWREGPLQENHNFPKGFRLIEPRLEAQLHPEARLFELPSNQSLGNELYIVRTRPFPGWVIAVKAILPSCTTIQRAQFATMKRHHNPCVL